LPSTPEAARFLLRVNPRLLLVAAGGGASDAAAVRGHAGEDRDAAVAGGETGPFRRRWEHRGPRRGKTLQRKALRCNEPVGIKLRHFLTSNTAQRLYKRE
jgi:hypothetical protein